MCIINKNVYASSSVAQQPFGGSAAAALENKKPPMNSIDYEASPADSLSSVPLAQPFQSPRWTGTRRIVRATRGGRRTPTPLFRIIPREWLMHIRDVKRARVEDSNNEGPVLKKHRVIAETDQRRWMQPFPQVQKIAYETFQQSHMLQDNVERRTTPLDQCLRCDCDHSSLLPSQ